MDQSSDSAINATSPAATSQSSWKATGLGVVGLLLTFFVLMLLWDYSGLLLASSRREQALKHLTPGMRITQAERVLNSEGYLTLYIDQSPPYLLVSTLTDSPVTAQLLHRLFPGSVADVWLREQLTLGTRFYVKADTSGSVEFTPAGVADHVLTPPPDVPPNVLL